MAKLYISDMHFFHDNLNHRMDCRGFKNAEELNAHMIRQWNSRVTDKDEVFLLGDFSAGYCIGTTHILEKLSGKPILEYMRPLLDELGISKDIWCVETPEGRSWTGSGILCTSRDLLRFGLFCLNRGEWQGRQLVAGSEQLGLTRCGLNGRRSRNDER